MFLVISSYVLQIEYIPIIIREGLNSNEINFFLLFLKFVFKPSFRPLKGQNIYFIINWEKIKIFIFD